MNKKVLALSMCLILMCAFVIGGCGGGSDEGAAQEPTYVNLATGGTAGTYYPLGGVFTDIWNKNIENVNSTPQSTGASTANVTMMRNGEVEVIFVQNDIAYYAYNGTEMFEGNKFEDIRGLVTLYPETIQIIAKADSGINTVADLKGKRVAVGAAGSGTAANAKQIMEAAGVTFDDIDVHNLSFAEAASNLKDGNVDAAFVTAGFPTAAVQDIAAQHDIILVEVDDEMADKLIEQYPFYTKIVIPAGTYNNLDKDSKAVAVKAMLAVSSELDEELAYQMVKTMYDNQDQITAAHKVGNMITKETGNEGMSVPLHPGAERAFNE